VFFLYSCCHCLLTTPRLLARYCPVEGGIASLAAALGGGCCPALRALRLGDCRLGSGLTSVADALAGCPRLEELDLQVRGGKPERESVSPGLTYLSMGISDTGGVWGTLAA
jgi:hypothetical protein